MLHVLALAFASAFQTTAPPQDASPTPEKMRAPPAPEPESECSLASVIHGVDETDLPWIKSLCRQPATNRGKAVGDEPKRKLGNLLTTLANRGGWEALWLARNALPLSAFGPSPDLLESSRKLLRRVSNSEACVSHRLALEQMASEFERTGKFGPMPPLSLHWFHAVERSRKEPGEPCITDSLVSSFKTREFVSVLGDAGSSVTFVGAGETAPFVWELERDVDGVALRGTRLFSALVPRGSALTIGVQRSGVTIPEIFASSVYASEIFGADSAKMGCVIPSIESGTKKSKSQGLFIDGVWAKDRVRYSLSAGTHEVIPPTTNYASAFHVNPTSRCKELAVEVNESKKVGLLKADVGLSCSEAGFGREDLAYVIRSYFKPEVVAPDRWPSARAAIPKSQAPGWAYKDLQTLAELADALVRIAAPNDGRGEGEGEGEDAPDVYAGVDVSDRLRSEFAGLHRQGFSGLLLVDMQCYLDNGTSWRFQLNTVLYGHMTHARASGDSGGYSPVRPVQKQFVVPGRFRQHVFAALDELLGKSSAMLYGPAQVDFYRPERAVRTDIRSANGEAEHRVFFTRIPEKESPICRALATSSPSTLTEAESATLTTLVQNPSRIQLYAGEKIVGNRKLRTLLHARKRGLHLIWVQREAEPDKAGGELAGPVTIVSAICTKVAGKDAVAWAEFSPATSLVGNRAHAGYRSNSLRLLAGSHFPLAPGRAENGRRTANGSFFSAGPILGFDRTTRRYAGPRSWDEVASGPSVESAEGRSQDESWRGIRRSSLLFGAGVSFRRSVAPPSRHLSSRSPVSTQAGRTAPRRPTVIAKDGRRRVDLVCSFEAVGNVAFVSNIRTGRANQEVRTSLDIDTAIQVGAAYRIRKGAEFRLLVRLAVHSIADGILGRFSPSRKSLPTYGFDVMLGPTIGMGFGWYPNE